MNNKESEKPLEAFIKFLKKPRKTEEIEKEFKDKIEFYLGEAEKKGWQVIRTGDKKIYLIDKGKPLKRVFQIVDVLDENGKAVNAKLIVMPNKKSWNKIRIVPLSDIHFGNINCDGDKLRNYINWIKRDEHVFCFLSGNCFWPESNSDIFFDNFFKFKETIFDVVKNKIMFIVNGPNEAKIERNKKIAINPLKALADIYEIPFFIDQANVAVNFDKTDKYLKIFAIHGKSNAVKIGSKINPVVNLLGFVDADIVVMSNMKYTASKRLETFVLDPVNIEVQQRKVYIMLLPSFLKYEGSDDAMKGYPPFYNGQINISFYRNGDYHIWTGELKEDKNGGIE